MSNCHHCEHKVSDKDVFCPECGTSLHKEIESEYCVHCGEALTEDSAFCIHCGTSKEKQQVEELPQEEKDGQVNVEESDTDHTIAPSQTLQETAAQIEPQRAKVKKKMATWKKVSIITSLIVVVLAFGTYKYLEHHFDPLHDLVKMDEALLDDDVDTFMDFIQLNSDIPIDKKAYFSYIKEYEWENGLKDDYYDLIEREKKDPSPLKKELTSRYSTPIIEVKDEKLLFGLFKNYTLKAVPVEVIAITNLDHTEVNIQDEKITLEEADEEKKVGKFYPGIYQLEAKTTSDYGEFVVEKEIEIEADEYAEMDIDFNYGTFSVDINNEFENATLFVNGKSTKKQVNEMDEVGPLPLDSEVKVHAEWKDDKDNVFRSNTAVLDEEEYEILYLEFDERIALDADESEDEDYELAEFILDFRSAYEYAVNYIEYEEIASFMKPGSKEEKDLKQFIKDMGKASYYYDFEDNTVTNVTKKDDKNFEVETNEQFTFHDEDGSVYEYDRDKVYYIEVVDKEYKIHNIDYKDTKKNRIN